ncbi:DUF4265 domain-containing protein [Kribbella sp. NPDC051586]|uniref:DUF4265 domain-containing protein n=1 Tax=Kribbella sp. NPDC051586 TaxID=3364118 RepID=UPI0037A09FD7
MDHQYKEHPTVTCSLVVGQLVPVPDSLEADVTVWLGLPEHGESGQIWEGLVAKRLAGQDRVEIRAIPMFAYDLNYGDEVAVVASAEGSLVATGISKDSRNYTFRIWLEHGDSDQIRQILTEFGGMGCLVEAYSAKLMALSCPPDAAQAVADALQSGELEGRFVYESGRQRTR